jgi:hypothetical protein
MNCQNLFKTIDVNTVVFPCPVHNPDTAALIPDRVFWPGQGRLFPVSCCLRICFGMVSDAVTELIRKDLYFIKQTLDVYQDRCNRANYHNY